MLGNREHLESTLYKGFQNAKRRLNKDNRTLFYQTDFTEGMGDMAETSLLHSLPRSGHVNSSSRPVSWRLTHSRLNHLPMQECPRGMLHAAVEADPSIDAAVGADSLHRCSCGSRFPP